MTEHDVPDYARAQLRRLTDRLDNLRTHRIRFAAAAAEVTAKVSAHPDPANTLRAAAMDRAAPVELVRVARAVREGRTTWQEIVDRRADSVPEVAAFQVHMNETMARLIASGELPEVHPAEDTASAQHDPLPQPRRPTPRDDDGDEIEIQWVRG